jgi:hypothetical protein
MTDRTDKLAALRPKSDAETGQEFLAALTRRAGELAELLNDDRWRHFGASWNIQRDATGRWYVQNVSVQIPNRLL